MLSGATACHAGGRSILRPSRGCIVIETFRCGGGYVDPLRLSEGPLTCSVPSCWGPLGLSGAHCVAVW
eukprot:10073641-Karenia_brevis.AAC.1